MKLHNLTPAEGSVKNKKRTGTIGKSKTLQGITFVNLILNLQKVRDKPTLEIFQLIENMKALDHFLIERKRVLKRHPKE